LFFFGGGGLEVGQDGRAGGVGALDGFGAVAGGSGGGDVVVVLLGQSSREMGRDVRKRRNYVVADIDGGR
jgi:hypothetical protein